MCYLNISSSLIRFKRALGDLQEHLEERELRGEGQRKSDTRHCDLRGFLAPAEHGQAGLASRWGSAVCARHAATPEMVRWESWEVLCNADSHLRVWSRLCRAA